MRSHRGRESSSLGAFFWASASYLLAGLALAGGAAVMLHQLDSPAAEASAPPVPSPILPPVSAPPPIAAEPILPSLLSEALLAQKEWREALTELCNDPELRAMDMRPDCNTGVIQLPHKLFFEFDSAALGEGGRRRLRDAIPIILTKLRERRLLWDNLDVIEVRGHADPRAEGDDPYLVNLVRSQERALNVLLFMTTDPSIPEKDREDLERLAVASGASSSRPPEHCETLTNDCYDRWRRAELRLGLNDAALRSDVNELLDRAQQGGL